MVKIHENYTKIVDSERDGKYKLTMQRHHDQTIIHVNPIFETATMATPDPSAAADENYVYWLAIAIGIALLLLILLFLLLFCCCCAACPLYEWRKRRKKEKREKEAAIAWRRKSAHFTAPMFEAPKVEANGKVPLLHDVEEGKTPVGMEDVEQKSAGKFESAAPPSGVWSDKGQAAPPSIVTTSDINTFSQSPSSLAVPTHDYHPLHTRKANTISHSVSTRGGIWDMELHSSTRETSSVDSCVVTADSLHLLTGSTHGPPCLWDLQTGTLLHALEGLDVTSGNLLLSANDQVLLALVQDHNLEAARMQMWDTATSARVHMSFPLFVSAMCALRRKPQVVLAQYDPESDANPALVVWDVLANEETCVIPFQHPVGMSAQSDLTFLKASFDDRLIVTGFINHTTNESCFMVFDLDAYHGEGILDPLVIPMDARLDCTVIASGRSEAVTGTRDGQIMVWNLLTGQPMRHLLESAVEHHTTSGQSSAVSADEIIILIDSWDGHLMVSGDSSGIVHFWNSHSERWLATVHVPLLSAITISQDSSLVATASSTGIIHLWRGNNGHPVAKISTSLDITSLLMANDRSAIVALGNHDNQQERGMMILRLTRGPPRHSITSSNHVIRSTASLRR